MWYGDMSIWNFFFSSPGAMQWLDRSKLDIWSSCIGRDHIFFRRTRIDKVKENSLILRSGWDHSLPLAWERGWGHGSTFYSKRRREYHKTNGITHLCPNNMKANRTLTRQREGLTFIPIYDSLFKGRAAYIYPAAIPTLISSCYSNSNF